MCSGVSYLYLPKLVGNDPIIVHKSKEYSQDLHFKIPLEWKVHHTPHGYMDRYVWLKSMTQSSNAYGASPLNNQILYFMDMIATLMTAHYYKGIATTSNTSY